MDLHRTKRKILDLQKERDARKTRKFDLYVAKEGMYPLNAPGMPSPGPDFMRVATGLGDGTIYQKNAKTKELLYVPGPKLVDLYKRALREPLFTLSVQVRGGAFKPVKFVPGHIWNENMDSWHQSMLDPSVKAKPVTGPHRAEIMVIGKMPWREETSDGRNFVSDTGEILINTCHKLHIKGLKKWYVTNLLKFMPPDESTTLKASWIDDCLPLLQQELRIVRPKYILFLGADASKEVLGKKFNVSYMEGRVLPLTFPIHLSNDDTPEFHTAQCMTVIHPAQIAREPTMERVLERGLSRWGLLISGADFQTEEEVDHRCCESLEEAEAWTEEAAAELNAQERKYQLIAVDAEWEGQHPINDNAWVATLQFSWAEKKAITFHLRNTKGKIVFRDRQGKPAIKRLAKLLNKFVNKYRVVGHFLVSDLEMIAKDGFDFTKGFEVPLHDDGDTPAWQRLMNGEGGLDTSAMAHAIEETAMLGLEHLAMRYTTCPRYDVPMEDAIGRLCKKLGIKRKALEGYGKIPRKTMIGCGKYATEPPTPSYTCYDADSCRRLCTTLMAYLDNDYEGNNCWEACWESMIIQPVILEMHQNGIFVDRKRLDELTMKFVVAKSALEDKIKLEANWSEFNIRSIQHVKEYLFGHKLNGKLNKAGWPVKIRPDDAKCLNIMPLLTTDKPPKLWSDIVMHGKTREHNPSTGKAVLAVLAQDNPKVSSQIQQIRDYRFLDQVLKTMLRPPLTDDDGDIIYESDELYGNDNLMIYDKGLASCIDDDGMVRTHLYPTAETGRWKSARPNLMNISKTRDPDYLRLLGYEDPETKLHPIYDKKLRSILMAPPEDVPVAVRKWRNNKIVVEFEKSPWVLIESDIKGAELYQMAIMCGSPAMLDHCERAINYPESGYSADGCKAPVGHKCEGLDKKGKPKKECELCGYPHPDFYDIHSNLAVRAFKLACHPSKFGLGTLGKAHLRNITKTAIFGLFYGRGAKAIAFAIKEQGVETTVDEVQKIIDSIFDTYPEMLAFFELVKARVAKERWLCHSYGRLRRFPVVREDDKKLGGEFERQGINYFIQGGVASFVDRWLATMNHVKRQLMPVHGEEIFQWQLMIHDASMIRAKPQYVDYIIGTLIPWSIQQIPIYAVHPDGEFIEDRGPYHFGVDTETYVNWGERISKERCSQLDIPTRYGR
jgi:uracil-DNA glycosylase family 4